jgi:hypothetical protein
MQQKPVGAFAVGTSIDRKNEMIRVAGVIAIWVGGFIVYEAATIYMHHRAFKKRIEILRTCMNGNREEKVINP